MITLPFLLLQKLILFLDKTFNKDQLIIIIQHTPFDILFILVFTSIEIELPQRFVSQIYKGSLQFSNNIGPGLADSNSTSLL